MARRGLCRVINSDNGTNFTGAELDRLFSAASNFSQEFGREITKDNMEWIFIPPRAPHFGGVW